MGHDIHSLSAENSEFPRNMRGDLGVLLHNRIYYEWCWTGIYKLIKELANLFNQNDLLCETRCAFSFEGYWWQACTMLVETYITNTYRQVWNHIHSFAKKNIITLAPIASLTTSPNFWNTSFGINWAILDKLLLLLL